MEYAMYIVVNNSVRMGKGKIVAQAGHCVWDMQERLRDKVGNVCDWKNEWLRSGTAKIVLKAELECMENLYNKYYNGRDIFCVKINDLGRTQVDPGTFTCMCFNPIPKDKIPTELAGLKLL